MKIVKGLIRTTTGGKKNVPAEAHMDCESCCNRYIAVTSSKKGNCWSLPVPYCFGFYFKGLVNGSETAICRQYEKPFDAQQAMQRDLDAIGDEAIYI